MSLFFQATGSKPLSGGRQVEALGESQDTNSNQKQKTEADDAPTKEPMSQEDLEKHVLALMGHKLVTRESEPEQKEQKPVEDKEEPEGEKEER